MGNNNPNPNLQCEIICVGGRRCTSNADFMVYRSIGPNKPQFQCTLHSLQSMEDDTGTVLTPIDQVPFNTAECQKVTHRCTRWIPNVNGGDNNSVRCTQIATFYIIAPDGSKVPGARECTDHAIEVITEYNTNVTMQSDPKHAGIWTLETIDKE